MAEEMNTLKQEKDRYQIKLYETQKQAFQENVFLRTECLRLYKLVKAYEARITELKDRIDVLEDEHKYEHKSLLKLHKVNRKLKKAIGHKSKEQE